MLSCGFPAPSNRGGVSQIVAVSTTARQNPSSHPVPFRCVSDHMVITNAQHLTITYSHFRYCIPLTALTTVPSRLPHTLVDIHTQQHTPPQGVHPNRMGSSLLHSRCGERDVWVVFGTPTGDSHPTCSHSRLLLFSHKRIYTIITKEYNKNINNSLGVGVVIRGCPQDSDTKVCSTHNALIATRLGSKTGYCSAYSNPPPLLTQITEENI